MELKVCVVLTVDKLLKSKPREGRELNFPRQSDDGKGAYGC